MSPNLFYREDEESLLPSPSTPTTVATSKGTIISLTETCQQLPKVLLHLLHQLLIFVIPSFLKRSPGSISLSEKAPLPVISQKKHSTEYLDGVRGLASFVVFIFHWTHIQFPGVNSGYEHQKNSSTWQLPIIRFVYSGAAMVSVFFVVSGYVLTHRFAQKMHRHEFDSLYSGLTSLTFRRAIRLFLPALASCMLAYVCASLGIIPIPKRVGGKKFQHGLPALLKYLDLESTPWTWDAYMKGFYNPQLWSISLEFRGSMVVFLVALGLARSRTSVRLLVQFLLTVHAFGHKRWDVALFVAGMSVAELDVLVNTSSSRKAMMQKKRTKIVLWTMIIVGVYLAGFPRDNGTQSLGYTFTKDIWPYTEYRRRFWLSIAAILIVLPLPYLPILHSFFNTGLIRYLGKISFALYLIHGLGNRTVGVWLLHFVWSKIGQEGFWRYLMSYVVSSLIYLPIIIWWSDMYWRAIDIPATNFAKWLEGRCKSTLPTRTATEGSTLCSS